MADKKSWWSTDGKISIVPQTFDPQTGMAETCREHSLGLCLALPGLTLRVDNWS